MNCRPPPHIVCSPLYTLLLVAATPPGKVEGSTATEARLRHVLRVRSTLRSPGRTRVRAGCFTREAVLRQNFRRLKGTSKLVVERLALNATPSKSRGPGHTIIVSGLRPTEKVVRHNPAEDALGKHPDRGSRFFAVEGHGVEIKESEGLCSTPSLPLRGPVLRDARGSREAEASIEGRDLATAPAKSIGRGSTPSVRGLGELY